MESIQLDRALRSPGLEGAAPRAANTTPSEARTERPATDYHGPKHATSTDRVDLREAVTPAPADSADSGANTDAERVREAVEALAENVQGLSKRSLEIRYSEEHSRFVVKILDTATGDVIRELPPEQLLDVASRIDEVRGLIFDEKS